MMNLFRARVEDGYKLMTDNPYEKVPIGIAVGYSSDTDTYPIAAIASDSQQITTVVHEPPPTPYIAAPYPTYAAYPTTSTVVYPTIAPPAYSMASDFGYLEQGTLYFPSKFPKYIGEMSKNIPHGEGILYYNSAGLKPSYIGHFIEGKEEGNGMEFFDLPGNVPLFTGLFRNGSRNGQGMEVSKDGFRVAEGTFINGNLDDGTKYIPKGDSFTVVIIVGGKQIKSEEADDHMIQYIKNSGV